MQLIWKVKFIYLIESELANEKKKVKGVERQILAENNMNTPPAMNKRKRKSWGNCLSRQKRIDNIKEKIVKVDNDDYEVTEITL